MATQAESALGRPLDDDMVAPKREAPIPTGLSVSARGLQSSWKDFTDTEKSVFDTYQTDYTDQLRAERGKLDVDLDRINKALGAKMEQYRNYVVQKDKYYERAEARWPGGQDAQKKYERYYHLAQNKKNEIKRDVTAGLSPFKGLDWKPPETEKMPHRPGGLTKPRTSPQEAAVVGRTQVGLGRPSQYGLLSEYHQEQEKLHQDVLSKRSELGKEYEKSETSRFENYQSELEKLNAAKNEIGWDWETPSHGRPAGRDYSPGRTEIEDAYNFVAGSTCLLFSFLYGVCSQQVRYAKVFCGRCMNPEALIGYYQIAKVIINLLEKHPKCRPFIERYLAVPLFNGMKWKLGRNKDVSFRTKLLGNSFVTICYLTKKLMNAKKLFYPRGAEICINAASNHSNKGGRNA